MKGEKLIHIKFEHDSALEAKRDILASEINLLKISRRLKQYKEYRLEELETKLKLEKKLRALKLDIGRIQNLLPGIKIPRILKPTSKRQEEHEIEKLKIPNQEDQGEIESELQKIQKKLSSLQ